MGSDTVRSMQTELDQTDKTQWLEQLLEEYDVPGVAVGILKDGELSTFTAGKAHVLADVDVTPDTLFPIASISKMFTTTAFMQLVAEGAVELDTPVVDVTPEVRMPQLGPAITARHFLSHTSGLDGDF